MAIYSKKKYEAEADGVIRSARAMSVASISSLQHQSKTLFNKSPSFIRRVIFTAPKEYDTLLRLLSAIESLKQGDVVFDRPEYVDVNAEWVFESDEAATQTSSATGSVIFFVHGGGSSYGSPGTARRSTRILATQARGCCIAIQYRYATVQPFPAQLLDLLVAYLSLLSAGTPNRRIIFAGESSGLGLVMALTQVLLYIRRTNSSILFHGQSIHAQLPIAIAGMSGWFDVTTGLPSWRSNGRWDTFPELQPAYSAEWEEQDLWPSNPPRADVYCERSAMTHPLVSPVAAKDWRGAPPCFIAFGQERSADANLYLAQSMSRQGVQVRLERWELMTHAWPTVLPHLPHSRRVMEHWAKFCAQVVEGYHIQTQGWDVSFETMTATPFDVTNCTSLTRETVLKYMNDSQKARLLVQRVGNPKI